MTASGSPLSRPSRALFCVLGVDVACGFGGLGLKREKKKEGMMRSVRAAMRVRAHEPQV